MNDARTGKGRTVDGSSRKPRSRRVDASIGGPDDGQRDHPPTYGEAVEQQESQGARPRRRTSTRTRRTHSTCSTASRTSADVEDDDDALSNLVSLTDSLIASSSGILAASRDLHSQLAQFLLSASPPSASSIASIATSDSLVNDVRSEINLNGDNWDRLNRLERDVERFEMRTGGKDPKLLAGLGRAEGAGDGRRASLNLPLAAVVTENGMTVVLEENGTSDDRIAAGTHEGSLRIGTPASGPTTSTLKDTAPVVTTRGQHLRRSSTAQDLLRHISSSSTVSSTPPTSKILSLNPSPSSASSTPSRRSSAASSGETFDPLRTPAARSHRLSISPSLPSLSSSATSTMSISRSTPVTDTPDDLSRRSETARRALSVSPSPSSVLSLSISTSSFESSPYPNSSDGPITSRRRASSSRHDRRRSTTAAKSGSVVRVDDRLGGLLDDDDDDDGDATGSVGRSTAGLAGRDARGTAAADKLRTLQSGCETAENSGAATSGSWWGWR